MLGRCLPEAERGMPMAQALALVWVAPEQNESGSSASGGIRRSGNGHPAQSTILVVEDEVLLRLAISDFLRECGYRVLEAVRAERFESSWLPEWRARRKRRLIFAMRRFLQNLTPTRCWRIISNACWRHSVGKAGKTLACSLGHQPPSGCERGNPLSPAVTKPRDRKLNAIVGGERVDPHRPMGCPQTSQPTSAFRTV